MDFSGTKDSTGLEHKTEDRRTFARMPAGLFVRYCPQFSLRHKTAQACDISAQGVGIVSSESIPVGRKVDIWIKMPTNNKEVPAKAKVAWFKRGRDNQFRIGLDLQEPNLMGIAIVMRIMHIQSRYYA